MGRSRNKQEIRASPSATMLAEIFKKSRKNQIYLVDLEICCFFLKPTSQCKHVNCFENFQKYRWKLVVTTLSSRHCPVRKWLKKTALFTLQRGKMNAKVTLGWIYTRKNSAYAAHHPEFRTKMVKYIIGSIGSLRIFLGKYEDENIQVKFAWLLMSTLPSHLIVMIVTCWVSLYEGILVCSK